MSRGGYAMNEMLLELGQNAKEAENMLRIITTNKKNQVLAAVAEHLVECTDELIKANAVDVENGKKNNMPEGLVDRLLLTPERIQGMAEGLQQLVALEDPIGEVTGMKKRPNGLLIGQKRVPLGVIGIIYEARPNVTADAFGLCFKTGNVVILKGGSDAIHSNEAIVKCIRETLKANDITENAIQLIQDTSRETAAEFMKMNEYVDVLIPRGGAGLIKAVVNQATIPVIETGAGICHTYFDEFGDVSKGADIIYNAKTRRVSVCNALDCTIVHEKRLDKLPLLCEKLKDSNVIIYADPRAYQALDGHYPAELLQPATKESFGTEFLDYKMAVKTVKSFEEALRHIQENSSRHSECIVTENKERAALFTKIVDAACIYTNVSTAFTDGAQFGLGAEIGISTQKLHARGPMGLEEMTSYKWVIEGNGQTRW